MKANTYPVFHVQHPRPTSWNTIIEAFSRELGLQVVPYSEWFAALEEAQRGLQALSMSGSAESAAATERILKENPALRLMDFFRAGLGYEIEPDVERYEPPGIVKLSCNKLESVSEALRATPEISAENVKRWVIAWKRSNFI